MAGYPLQFAQRYRDAGYWIGQTHTSMLAESAARRPDDLAVLDSRRALTYAELVDGSHTLAHGLVSRGFPPGSRVVVQLPNVTEYLEVVFALFDAGLVPVFALASHGSAEVVDLVGRSEAVAHITADGAGVDGIEIGRAVHAAHPAVTVVVAALGGDTAAIPAPMIELGALRTDKTSSTQRSSAPSELAFLQLSGGTTGAPKLIPRTHDDYLYSVRESAAICGLDADSVFGVVLPVSHNFTMSSPGVLGALHAGASIVMIESADADTVFDAVARHRITQLSAVPPLVAAWIDSPARTAHDISSLRVLQVGGAKLSRTLALRVPEAFGVVLQQVFGMAEGLVNYTRLDDDPETIADTQGRPISPADEIRVVEADGTILPVGEAGSLETRGPYTIRGYWQGQSPESFTADGFYRTGDRVILDDRGYLRVVGRDKDQINRAGEKVAPEEIENLLLGIAGVRDVSVVGVPDDRLGERIVAYLIPAGTGDATMPDEFGIRAHLREQGLARFKIPDDVLVVDEFPTTAVGKISKNRQRDEGVAADAADPAAQVRADLAAKLGLDPQALPGSIALADSGIDSLQLMALLDKWRAEGADELDFETLATSPTIDDLIAGVVSARDGR